MTTGQWIVVVLAAAPLSAVVGVLVTLPLWRSRRGGPLFVPALLTVHAGVVIVAGTVTAAAAARSWLLVENPKEHAAGLLEVSRIDGDGSLYALVVLVLVAATALAGMLLAMAARFAASRHQVDRAVACTVLGLEIGLSGVGVAYVVGGSRHPLAVLAVAHLPLVVAAMVRCWPSHPAALPPARARRA